MPRYYKKKSFRGSRDKYSVEHTAVSLTTNASGDAGVNIVPPTTIQGMRKVKHLTISMGKSTDPSIQSGHLYWAIVYVPQGTTPSTIAVDNGGQMYEPNQFVMGCGIFDFDGGPLRVHCPLARNLNSGDSIALIVHNPHPLEAHYNACISYAITLQ